MGGGYIYLVDSGRPGIELKYPDPVDYKDKKAQRGGKGKKAIPGRKRPNQGEETSAGRAPENRAGSGEENNDQFLSIIH